MSIVVLFNPDHSMISHFCAVAIVCLAVIVNRGFLVLFWLVVVAVANEKKKSVTVQLEKYLSKQEGMRGKNC